MRWSQMFIPTLREEPSNVEAASHRLLLRAGFIRQLTAGVYSLLPIGQRVRLKIINIIREEMNKIGGQEFVLSALQPLELWEESGRKDAVSDIMFRLKDRKGAELALGLTHEEVFTSIARAGLNSYKQLPQIWYQIQCKFRDEARPRAGLLRVREFTMKDSYSFDFDSTGLDAAFQAHYDAYCNIFTRCNLKYIPVEASSGAMGGTASVEFMYSGGAGEDTLLICSSCNYAANSEKAESKISVKPVQSEQPLEQFPTPQIRTIKQLEDFPGGAAADSQIKTLVFMANETELVIALVQGDQELNESKLQATLACSALRQAQEQEIFMALGAHPGSLGACAVIPGADKAIKKIIADNRLKDRHNMVTGANKDDFHLRGVSIERDVQVDTFADLHTVKDGEECIKCGAALRQETGLEIGHIFKLGTRYSEIMNAKVIGADGQKTPILMGSYGIGVERLMAAIAEQYHDDAGLKWPISVAPYEVVLVLINNQDSAQKAAAEEIYAELSKLGIDVLIDDRDDRAGVKFNDADLVGFPFRVTIGKKVVGGIVELLNRQDGTKTEIPIPLVATVLRGALWQDQPSA